MPPKSGNRLGETLIGENRRSTELRKGLDHQHAGKCRPTGKMTRKECFISRQLPLPAGTLTGHELGDVTDKTKWRPMRYQIFDDPVPHPDTRIQASKTTAGFMLVSLSRWSRLRGSPRRDRGRLRDFLHRFGGLRRPSPFGRHCFGDDRRLSIR